MSKCTLSCWYSFECFALCIACAVAATKTGAAAWWFPTTARTVVAWIFAVYSVDIAPK